MKKTKKYAEKEQFILNVFYTSQYARKIEQNGINLYWAISS